MGSSVPTTTTDRDWNRIDAGHQAVDQLNQIVGELRGTLEHDPHAAGRLRTALAILLGDQDTPAVGTPVTVVEGDSHSLTVTPEVLKFGKTYPAVSIRETWGPGEEDMNAHLTLTADHADALADALHAAAASARRAVTR